MSRRVNVIITCDLHDNETVATHTTTVALDGNTREVDLCDKHQEALEKALSEVLAAGRRMTGPQRRQAATGPKTDTRAIREWAAENGVEVPARGRIPAAIVEQYQAAIA